MNRSGRWYFRFTASTDSAQQSGWNRVSTPRETTVTLPGSAERCVTRSFLVHWEGTVIRRRRLTPKAKAFG